MAGELTCHCRKRLGSGFELEAKLRIPLAESPVTVLFGPSGAGKTTLLRLLAGLDRPDDGAIAVGDATWYDAAVDNLDPTGGVAVDGMRAPSRPGRTLVR